MTAFDLTDSIHGIHERLAVQLRERRNIPHPTLKGDEGELLWLEALANHLPRRYAVRRGIVIDSRGQRSEQIDLIVYDPQYTPVFLAQGEHAYVLAEAVYAVFEVKYTLSGRHIREAVKKAASVRRLHRTNGFVPMAGSEPKPPRGEPFRQLAGLLTLDHAGFGPLETKLRDQVAKHEGKGAEHEGKGALDLVLCLEGGLLEANRPPPDAGAVFEPGTKSFVQFLFSLFHRLMLCATAPVVEWDQYVALLRTLGDEPRVKETKRPRARSKARV